MLRFFCNFLALPLSIFVVTIVTTDNLDKAIIASITWFIISWVWEEIKHEVFQYLKNFGEWVFDCYCDFCAAFLITVSQKISETLEDNDEEKAVEITATFLFKVFKKIMEKIDEDDNKF